MKRILFVTSQYRVGERIYPIIPELAKEFDVDLLKLYQMSKGHRWVGDYDMRTKFDAEYLHFFNDVYENTCDVKNYDLIISDDNRHTQKTNLHKLYSQKNCPMVSFEHGNNNKPYFELGHKVVFDKCFVFGEKDIIHEDCIAGGIPANDKLKDYMYLPKKHILVIVNFLGNRTSEFKVNFDENLFKSIDIVRIQKHFELPVIIKLKSRADEGGYENNLKYLKKILPSELDYKIVIDVDDDNKLIAESKCVVSALSTLSFKAIQLGIPTALIADSGQVGSFYDYGVLFDLHKEFLPYLIKEDRKLEWISKSISGGVEFNSTQIVIKRLKELL